MVRGQVTPRTTVVGAVAGGARLGHRSRARATAFVAAATLLFAIPALGGVAAASHESAVWAPSAELPSPAAPGAQFGYSVAISGATAVVGAPENDVAYVFSDVGGTWNQTGTLSSADAGGSHFGTSVGISGNTVIVGAPSRNTTVGAAYIFGYDGTNWVQQAELTMPTPTTDDYFGTSVSIDGTTAVVGAFGRHAQAGSAEVFKRRARGWTPTAEISASSGGYHFGFSVAISGSTIVVGSIYSNLSGHFEAGAAFVFADTGTGWSQQAVLTASDEKNDRARFGWDVAISGSTILVGAPFHTVARRYGAGTVYAFVNDGTGWAQEAELTPGTSTTYQGFGYSVAVSRSAAVVGSGDTAYIFSRRGSSWVHDTSFAANIGLGNNNNDFVALSGSTIIVGSVATESAAVYSRSH